MRTGWAPTERNPDGFRLGARLWATAVLGLGTCSAVSTNPVTSCNPEAARETQVAPTPATPTPPGKPDLQPRDEATPRVIPPAKVASGRIHDLKLRLVARKTVVVTDEPVVIDIELANPTKNQVTVLHDIASAAADIKVVQRRVSDGVALGNQEWKIGNHPWCGNDHARERPWIVEPGKTLRSHGPSWLGVRYSLAWIQPSAPGRYDVEATLTFRTQPPVEIRSNRIFVTVRPPSGDDKYAQRDFYDDSWLRGLQGELIMNSGSHHSTAQLIEFVERHPRSIYAQFAAYTLASGCFYGEPEKQRAWWSWIIERSDKRFPLLDLAKTRINDVR